MPNTSFDLVKKVNELLPNYLRTPPVVAFCRSLLAPMRTLFSDFAAYVLGVRYEVSKNGTVQVLERIINDELDPGLRRMYIRDEVNQLVPTTLYLEEEIPPGEGGRLTLLDETPGAYKTLYLSEEYAGENDFVVFYPFDQTRFPLLVGQEAPWEVKLKGLIDKYRFAGTRWTYKLAP